MKEKKPIDVTICTSLSKTARIYTDNYTVIQGVNEDTKEVVCFNLFQIGELANGLSVEFIKEFNKMPWKQIIGMRNRIVHGYDTINFEIVWRTAIESIPELKSYCEEILN